MIKFYTSFDFLEWMSSCRTDYLFGMFIKLHIKELDFSIIKIQMAARRILQQGVIIIVAFKISCVFCNESETNIFN